jgi:TolB-like protein/class 3 adenylate cyclase
MSETRKLAAILVSDVVGYSRLAGRDEELTLARLRALRSDLIDPIIAVHHGRIVKRTGDGAIVEFRSVVDAVRCAIEVQSGMVERNAGLPADRQIQFRVGIHLGDVVEEADGDLMGDGVNIAARLESICEPGAICLSEDAYRQVRSRLDLVVADLGNKELKNIPEPVHVFSLEVGKPAHAKLAAPQSMQRVAEPPRLSIVVLPFANIGGDPEQEYFVDGVTESLTTDLSRMAGSFVIGRNTAFTYKGKPIDLKKVGHELNVRYVLEGSVQRAANRLRVNVQLIEAESGAHLWAERFDKPLADLFDMQDEIVTRLARALSVELVAAEAMRTQTKPKLDSMDLFFRAQAIMNLGEDAQTFAQARELYRRAIAADENNVDAIVGWAYALASAAAPNYMSENRTGDLNAAEKAAVQAIRLAPNHAMAHLVLGMTYYWTNRVEQSRPEIERAIVLDRNLTQALAAMAVAEMYSGHPERVESYIAEAFRLSPHDVLGFIWCHIMGQAKLMLGLDVEAIGWLRRGLEINRRNVMIPFMLGAALALVGSTEEAQIAVREGLVLNPRISVRVLRETAPSRHPVYLSQRERIYEGMRRAGVPEE